MTDSQFENFEELSKNEIVYPFISDRIKAGVIDMFVIIIFMVILTTIFSMFDKVSDGFRIAGFIFIFLIYEPLFISQFASTIGQRAMNIQVKRNSDIEKNILFPLALIRYIVKVFLGWISLLTMLVSKKHLAIHDMAVKSIVLYRKKPEAIES